MAIGSFLERALGRAPAPAPAAPQTVQSARRGALPPHAVYPPADPGLPNCAPEDIVAAAQPRLKRLRELAVSDAAQFDGAYMEPIRQLARLVHLLPASPSEHYAAPAGLFNLCIDVAFGALQSADGKIFTPHGSVEDRHHNEPRWRYATFLAGLVCQIYRSLTQMTVTNERGEEWPRFSMPLADWLAKCGSQRYYVNWHAKSTVTGGEGAGMLAAIAPKPRMDWLAEADVQIVRDLHQVAMGASHKADSIMAAVVVGIVDRVLESDKATQRSRYGRLTAGMHLEPYILDAFRHLLQSGEWKINQGPVWHGTDALFIEWPGAHADVARVFDENRLTGIPRAAATLAEVLGKAGVVHQNNGLWVWDILVPADGGQTRAAKALRFADPLAIFGLLDVPAPTQAFSAEVVMGERAAAAMLAAPAQPAAQPASAVAARQPAPPIAPPSAPAPSAASDLIPPAEVAEATGGVPPRARDIPPEAVDNEGEIRFAKLVKADAARLIGSQEDIAEALGQLVHHHSRHRGDIVKAMPYGVALSVDWIVENTNLVDVAPMVRVLKKQNWLAVPPGAKSPNSQVHDVKFDDKLKSAIVVSKWGAEKIGFTGARA